MTRQILYQVDFIKRTSGKRISSTKIRTLWKFGFAHQESIESGLIGPECRGEEHSVEFIWSIASGKCSVILDDKEVHYSIRPRRERRFQYNMFIKGGYHVRIYAQSHPFAKKGLRQFDLFIDDVSYFDFCKIYELGEKSMFGIAAQNETFACEYDQDPTIALMDVQAFDKSKQILVSLPHEDLLDFEFTPSNPMPNLVGDILKAQEDPNTNPFMTSSATLSVTRNDSENEPKNQMYLAPPPLKSFERQITEDSLTYSVDRNASFFNVPPETLNSSTEFSSPLETNSENQNFSQAKSHEPFPLLSAETETSSLSLSPPCSKSYNDFTFKVMNAYNQKEQPESPVQEEMQPKLNYHNFFASKQMVVETPSLEDSATSTLYSSGEICSHKKVENEDMIHKLVNIDDIFGNSPLDCDLLGNSIVKEEETGTSKVFAPVVEYCGAGQMSLKELQSAKQTSTIKEEMIIQQYASQALFGSKAQS